MNHFSNISFLLIESHPVPSSHMIDDPSDAKLLQRTIAWPVMIAQIANEHRGEIKKINPSIRRGLVAGTITIKNEMSHSACKKCLSTVTYVCRQLLTQMVFITMTLQIGHRMSLPVRSHHTSYIV